MGAIETECALMSIQGHLTVARKLDGRNLSRYWIEIGKTAFRDQQEATNQVPSEA